MERGPYDRPPPGPGQPRRDSGYEAPPEYERPTERRFGIAEVVAILALLAAVVAIFLAIDARDDGAGQQQVERQVRQETQRQIEEIRSSVGEQAGNAGARARAAEKEAEQAQEAASELRSQVAGLEKEVSSLQTQQNQVRESLEKQSEAISDIRDTLREQG